VHTRSLVAKWERSVPVSPVPRLTPAPWAAPERGLFRSGDRKSGVGLTHPKVVLSRITIPPVCETSIKGCKGLWTNSARSIMRLDRMDERY